MRVFLAASGRIVSARRFRRTLAGVGGLVTAALLLPLPASAHEYKVGAIEIGHPWSRATPPSAKTGAGYLTLSNGGSESDRLVGITSPAAKAVSVHEMSVVDGVMRMKPVEGGLDIPAGGKVALEPGGLHLMMTGLSKPLVEGDKIPATLTFEKAGAIDVLLAVDKLGATAPAAAAAAGSGHSHGE